MEKFPSQEVVEVSPQEKHSEWMEEMKHKLKGAGVGLMVGAGVIAMLNVAKAMGVEIPDNAISTIAATQAGMSGYYYLTHMGKNKRSNTESDDQ